MSRTPFVPVPEPSAPVETYTVVVNEVPVKELLFALARDAQLNVDIHPDVEGSITLNAVDQSLIQILDRISRQVDLRYEVRGDSILVGPDRPFLRTYIVDYVDMARNTENTVKVSTGVIASVGEIDGGGGGGGGANSETSVDSVVSNQFWETLIDSVRQMLAGERNNVADDSDFDAEQAVIANEDAGVLIVRATARQHEDVQRYLDQVLNNSKRQVLVEATIVEVELSDRYQAGVDWARVARDAGIALTQSVATGGFLAFGAFPLGLAGVGSTASLSYADSRDAAGNPDGVVNLTVNLLKGFGDTRVLSSPKIMALNNQTAVLQVVENFVYFEVDSSTTQVPDAGAQTSIDTTAKTVPVGVILQLTPQIDGADQVILNVRPTISRVARTVDDPNPALVIPNRVPQIVVREMESVLRIGSGQIAVLGGLMQDQVAVQTDDVPVLAETPGIGEAFRQRTQEQVKTELVIFLRPWVIRSPDVRTDLVAFQPLLPENLEQKKPVRSDIGDQLNTPPGTPVN